MKHFVLLTITIFLVNISFCQTKVYEGVINGKYKIEMHLNFINKSIHGYYFYKSKHIPIALFGEQQGTKIKLIESDLTDTSIFFQGDILGVQINGQWQDIYKKNNLSFSLKQIETKDSIQHFFIKNGDYENKGSSSKNSKYCSIFYVDKNLFYYKFSVATFNCDGQVFGIAKLYFNGRAQSIKTSNVEDDCRLNFTFKNNIINVVEEGICDSHGASCTFGGEFICFQQLLLTSL